MVANTYLEGTYSELYPDDHPGRRRGCAGCSGSSPSPAASPATWRPETPGSIHEGGELGYSLVARLRRGVRQPGPDRGLRRSATARPRPGRWPASWHSNKFLNPVTDGAVLPILHLNGYKIANPTVLARIPHEELRVAAARLRLQPRTSVEGDDPRAGAPAARRDAGHGARRDPRHPAPAPASTATWPGRRWPMIVLRTPKGWTGPKVVDGLPVEGTWRAHQVPLAAVRQNPEHLASCSRSGCAATGRRSCSTPTARSIAELAALAPAATGG